MWLILLRAPPAPFVPEEWHGKRICAMAVCYSGDLDRVDEALAPIRALGDPVVDLLAEQPYIQCSRYLDDTEPKGTTTTGRPSSSPSSATTSSSTARELAAECPIPEAEMGFLHLGGALNERDEDDGAVGNRDARYAFGVIGMWEPDEPEADAFRQWIRDAWQRLRPFSTGGNYINFQTADEGDERIRATYGRELRPARRGQAQYDPDNLFRANRNIPPGLTTASVDQGPAWRLRSGGDSLDSGRAGGRAWRPGNGIERASRRA